LGVNPPISSLTGQAFSIDWVFPPQPRKPREIPIGGVEHSAVFNGEGGELRISD
jgi:hypothetical protein